MSVAYFEFDSLKNLSNIELIRKHKQVLEKYDLAKNNKFVPYESVKQLYELTEIYTAELDRRISEDLIDEDELEDEYEDFV